MKIIEQSLEEESNAYSLFVYAIRKKDFNNKEDNSIFNIAAVGDFDCNDDAEVTVDNIIDQDPELVLALGDFSYNGDAEFWLDMIEPIADKTK